MIVVKKYFPVIQADNEITYFQYLQGILESVDELASMEIIKGTDSYKFRIAPSSPEYRDGLLERILEIHNLFHIKLDLSKSIKTTGTISFEITL